MTMSAFTAVLRGVIQMTGRRTIGIDNPTDEIKQTYQQSVAVGTGSGQINEMFHVNGTIAGGANDYDVRGGIVDALGQTVTMVEVCLIALKNNGVANMIIGNDAAAFVAFFGAAAHTVTVAPGGFFMIWNLNDPAWVPVAGTGDVLQVAGTNGDTFHLIIGGRQA